jgi:hypothetical protein
MYHETDAEASTPPKYSRYRSVRRTAKESPPGPTHALADQNDPLRSSTSRYRRTNAAPKYPDSSASPYREPVRRATEPVRTNQRQATRSASEGGQTSRGPRETESERRQRQAREIRGLEGQQWRVQKAQEAEEEELRILRQTTEEILAEQKRKDLERLEATLEAAIQGHTASRVTSPRGKFGFFSKKSAQPKLSPPLPSPTGSDSLSITCSRGNNDPPRRAKEPPSRGIEQRSGGIGPGTDAPISAVNAGERVGFVE